MIIFLHPEELEILGLQIFNNYYSFPSKNLLDFYRQKYINNRISYDKTICGIMLNCRCLKLKKYFSNPIIKVRGKL